MTTKQREHRHLVQGDDEMSQHRVFVVEDMAGRICEVFANMEAAEAYADVRGFDCWGVETYEVNSEFVMPPLVWKVTVDERGSEIKRVSFLDWNNEYCQSYTYCYRKTVCGVGGAWGTSRDGPEDALRVARAALKKDKEQMGV